MGDPFVEERGNGPGLEAKADDFLGSLDLDAKDSLDIFQSLGAGGASAGSGAALPISARDLAAGSVEDFNTFMARLRKQSEAGPVASPAASPAGYGAARSSRPPLMAGASTSQRGSPTGDATIPARERVRTNSPALQSAANAVLRTGSVDVAPSGRGVVASWGSRPSSAGSGAHLSLRELRQQRRKPRTAEDVALPGQEGRAEADSAVPVPDGGPGLPLNATAVASLGARPEPGSLGALRSAVRRPPSRDRVA